VMTQSFQWPARPGWRAETIAFPPEFAPDLSGRGVEEVRFAPGFFDPDAADRWAYAFVWWLRSGGPRHREQLLAALERYYRGLCMAAAGDRFTFSHDRFAATLTEGIPWVVMGHPAALFRGTVATYDPFATGRPIVLGVEIWSWRCTTSRRRATLIAALPGDGDPGVRRLLDVCRRDFTCH
jgi:hypothetical protein